MVAGVADVGHLAAVHQHVEVLIELVGDVAQVVAGGGAAQLRMADDLPDHQDAVARPVEAVAVAILVVTAPDQGAFQAAGVVGPFGDISNRPGRRRPGGCGM
jgi:hypothetical protein